MTTSETAQQPIDRPPTGRPALRVFRGPDDVEPAPPATVAAAAPRLVDVFEASFRAELVEVRKVSAKTLAEYQRSVGLWSQSTTEPLQSIGADTVSAFSAWLLVDCKYALPTVDKHVRNIMAILRHAAANHIIPKPVSVRKTKRSRRAPQGSLRVDQLATWIDGFARFGRPALRLIGQNRRNWVYAICFVLYYTGLRPCACLRLRWSDLDPVDADGWRRFEVRSEINKGDNGYWHQLHPEAVDAVGRLRRQGEFLFASQWPKLAAEDVCKHDHARMTLGRAMRAAATWVGVELPPHNVIKCWRKSHATILAGISEMATKVSMGHSLGVTEANYTDHTVLLRDAITQMPSLREALGQGHPPEKKI